MRHIWSHLPITDYRSTTTASVSPSITSVTNSVSVTAPSVRLEQKSQSLARALSIISMILVTVALP